MRQNYQILYKGLLNVVGPCQNLSIFERFVSVVLPGIPDRLGIFQRQFPVCLLEAFGEI